MGQTDCLLEPQARSVRLGSRTVSDVDRYRKTYGFLVGLGGMVSQVSRPAV